MKLTTKKLEELKKNGYYVESINKPEPKPKPKPKPEPSAAPAPKAENKPKQWRFDVERDMAGFITGINVTEIPQ